MNEKLRIVLSTAVWCGLLAYIIFAVRLCSAEKENISLSGVEIEILDRDKHRMITESSVEAWLRKGGYVFTDSAKILDFNTHEIASFIESHSFVRNARVYTDLNGKLHIEMTQRKPIMRFNTNNGYDFYISDDYYVMPVIKESATYLPIITGTLAMPFPTDFSGSLTKWITDNQKNSDQNYLYLLKLINFVKLISNSTFWDAQIVQVNVTGQSGSAAQSGSEKRWKEPIVELVPRIGRHIVILGSPDDAEVKLEKLMLFYRKALDYEGWDTYRTIDLRYKDQIVCRE